MIDRFFQLHSRGRVLFWIGAVLLGVGSTMRCPADDLDRKPIEYGSRQGDNPISRLQHRLERGEVELSLDGKLGFLPDLLRALEVPVESQTLVFSKTSFQRNRISPTSPRAVYFNDEVYVGFCRGGQLLELSVADSEMGTEFYALANEDGRPKIIRQTEECLICHGSSATRGTPGHLFRSVYPDASGHPILSMGSHRVDPTLEWEKRFGGWYVSGRHGTQSHLGNLIHRRNVDPTTVDRAPGQNQTSLSRYFDASSYASGSSDIVALQVLNHQIYFHNQLAKLSLETRLALYDEKQLNSELEEPADKRWESTSRRIRGHATDLVKAMFFAEESEMPSIEGTTDFAKDFASKGVRDQQGRSLRDLRLQERLMKYPCSFLIYSPSFQGMPQEAMTEVVSQMKQVIEGKHPESSLSRLSQEDRTAIDEILRDTWPRWKG